jgi:Tfp pilus assembly protein PilZ
MVMKKQNRGIEDRKSERVMMVKPLKGHVDADPPRRKEEHFGVHLMNISLTGAQVYSNKSLEVGDDLDLELHSLDGTQSFLFKGKIVWVHKTPLKFMGRFAYGVHFSNKTKEATEFLKANFYLTQDDKKP